MWAGVEVPKGCVNFQQHKEIRSNGQGCTGNEPPTIRRSQTGLACQGVLGRGILAYAWYQREPGLGVSSESVALALG